MKINKNNKLKIIILLLGLPLILLTNEILIYFIPSELNQKEKLYWFILWSGSLAIVIGILIIAGIYRFINAKNYKKNNKF